LIPAMEGIAMAARAPRVEIEFEGETCSATYSVKRGALTVRLGLHSKPRQLGGLNQRVLARLLLHRLMCEKLGREGSLQKR